MATEKPSSQSNLWGRNTADERRPKRSPDSAGDRDPTPANLYAGILQIPAFDFGLQSRKGALVPASGYRRNVGIGTQSRPD